MGAGVPERQEPGSGCAGGLPYVQTDDAEVSHVQCLVSLQFSSFFLTLFFLFIYFFFLSEFSVLFFLFFYLAFFFFFLIACE